LVGRRFSCLKNPRWATNPLVCAKAHIAGLSILEEDFMPSRHIAIGFTLASATLAALIGTSITGCGSDKSTGGGDQVAQGQQAVTQFACKSCHKEDLGGDTNVYPNSKAYPANLTPDPDTGLGSWDTATIAKAILDGIDDEGAPLCVMPKFRASGMTDAQANAIAAYLKSVPAVTRMIPESDCGGGAM
jgi:mono/diheme cytochrome c family protein